MDVINTFIHDNVKLIMTVAVIAIGIVVFKKASTFADYFTQNINMQTTEFQESGKTKYDGVTCTGSEVVAAIRKFQTELKITVVRTDSTGAAQAPIVFSGLSSVLNLPTDANYVNPNGSFIGDVKRSVNGVITEIVFTKTGTNSVSNSNSTSIAGNTGTGTGTSGGSTGGTSTVVTATDIANLTVMINSLSTAIQQQKATIESLTDKLNDLYTAYNTANGGGVPTDGDYNTENGLQYDGEVYAANRQLDAVGDATNSLNVMVNTLSSYAYTIADYAGEGNSVADSSAVKSLQDQLDDLQNEADTLAATIAKFTSSDSLTQEDVEQIETLSTTLTSVENQIAEIKSLIGGGM